MSDQTSWLSRVSPPLEPGGGTSSLETDVIAPRITMAKRTLGGARQTVTDAGAYIVHLPTCSPDIALAELRAHGEILRAGNRVMLIPTSHFLTEPGSTANRRAEGVARSRDLSLLQLANAKEMELTELLEMIDSVKVNNGKLIVTRKLLTADNVIVALVVKYQMTEP
ncbi:hypothetical protein GGR56DRAFT_661445 [Xylariaceae sp. FL0804]|nr:hypothetical protein GGR56DRAFT_661445 [Xylariaceae sp. FL0804]